MHLEMLAHELDPKIQIIGTTWIQEIVWFVHTNVDIESAKRENVWSRMPIVAIQPPNEQAGLIANFIHS